MPPGCDLQRSFEERNREEGLGNSDRKGQSLLEMLDSPTD